MIQSKKSKTLIILLFMIFLVTIVTACAQETPIPTETPTAELKSELEPEPEIVSVKIVSSEAVVDKIIVQDPDQESESIEILVQGHTSNTCLSVNEINIRQEESVFSIVIDSSLKSDSDCIEKDTQFEEVITIKTDALLAGTYVVTSGIAQNFDFESAQIADVPDEPSEQDTSDGDTSTEGESGTVEETATSVESQTCEDRATFLSDVTYSDNASVNPGERFVKTWEIRNDGDCIWGVGYELHFDSGSFSDVVSLADPFPDVAPLESIEISVELTAPDTPGAHSGIWKIKSIEGAIIEVQAGADFDLWATVIVTGDATVVGGSGVVCSESNFEFESQLLQLINTARAANGVPAYELNTQLAKAARAHSEDMACNEFINHTGSDGSSWNDRITAQGYSASDSAENIYFGYGVMPEMAVSWWMNSEIHRGNILHSDLTQIGIAFALNPQTGAGYYTLVFATP